MKKMAWEIPLAPIEEKGRRHEAIRELMAFRKIDCLIIPGMHSNYEFVATTSDADLIVLHGMGRAVESNFHAVLRCDALRTAVLKDEQVAARLGGKLFDCLFEFRPAAT